MLLNLKLFSCYCEENDKPIMDWMKLLKAEFNQFTSSAACYRATEKGTIPPSSKFNFSRPDIATVPKNVTSTPMISLSSSPSANIPRASSSALATATSKHVLFSESQDVEDFASNSTELQHALHTILPKAIDSPLIKALQKLFKMFSCLIELKGMLFISPKLMAVQVLFQLIPRTGCLQSSSLGSTVRMQESRLSTGSRSQGMSSIDSEVLTLTMLPKS